MQLAKHSNFGKREKPRQGLARLVPVGRDDVAGRKERTLLSTVRTTRDIIINAMGLFTYL